MKIRLLSILLFGVMVQGCGTPQVDTTKETEFTNFHRAEAKQLIDKGQYHQARTHLEILNAFDQSNTELKNEIKLLNVLMETKTAPLISKGRKELKSGQYKIARKTLLKALAIDPENQQAFQLLRQANYIRRRHKQGEEIVYSYSNTPSLEYDGFRRNTAITLNSRARNVSTVNSSGPIIKPAKKEAITEVITVQSVEKAVTPPAVVKPKPANNSVTKPASVANTKAKPVAEKAKDITAGYEVKRTEPVATRAADVKTPASAPIIVKTEATMPETQPSVDKIVVAKQAEVPRTREEAVLAMVAGKPPAETITPETEMVGPEAEPAAEPEKQDERYLAPFRAYYEKQEWSALIKSANYLPKDEKMPPQLKGWLFEAHLQNAQTFRKQNKLDSALGEASLALDYANDENKPKADSLMAEIRDQLSQQLYAQGQKVFHTDIEKAISLWETALIYKENYPEVKHQLQKAYLIRKNLGDIQLDQ